jgi:hypothetical protein
LRVRRIVFGGIRFEAFHWTARSVHQSYRTAHGIEETASRKFNQISLLLEAVRMPELHAGAYVGNLLHLFRWTVEENVHQDPIFPTRSECGRRDEFSGSVDKDYASILARPSFIAPQLTNGSNHPMAHKQLELFSIVKDFQLRG